MRLCIIKRPTQVCQMSAIDLQQEQNIGELGLLRLNNVAYMNVQFKAV